MLLLLLLLCPVELTGMPREKGDAFALKWTDGEHWTPGGVQGSCAYRRTPVGRVQGCCQVCVCACVAVLYNALRSSWGLSFFISG